MLPSPTKLLASKTSSQPECPCKRPCGAGSLSQRLLAQGVSWHSPAGRLPLHPPSLALLEPPQGLFWAASGAGWAAGARPALLWS